MKKMCMMILCIMLCCCMCAQVTAEGLFGSIIKEARMEEPLPLPSFSVYSRLPHDKITTDETKTQYTYHGVSLEVFEAFGVYLGELGYTILNMEVLDNTYFMEIGKAKTDMVVITEGKDVSTESFVVTYNINTLDLETIYTADSLVQKYAFVNNMPFAQKADRLYVDSVSDHFGNSYAYSLAVDSGSISIPNNGQYSTFAGVIAYPGERGYDSYRTSAALAIYADGKKVYESGDCDISTYPIVFEANIDSCNVVEIKWSSKGSNIWENWGYEATIYNGIFY